ncbi:hypothetical protein FUA48_17565 [Flavobacterium alkalisoli]|uniref:Uncharacterized protein n=1 Tax=Flavobacterium alkalisoli TaxID=2602769 RepID=A0A5B9FZN5_9FLAO|nr:hypothetical protein [Flavobacterium alkalisoli]QEE51308.1 hypothetical protein FUA48_17565 [Flavobacterium alkalisoli]
MFQLYKQRNFGALISDTFTFFKAHGKNYLKSYFIISGSILLVISLVTFLLAKFILGGDEVTRSMMDNGTFYILAFLGCFVYLVLSLVCYSVAVFYLKAIQEKEAPETKEIIALLKAKLGKIVLFPIASLISFIPLITLVLIVSGAVSALIFATLGLFGSILGFFVFVVMGSFMASWVLLSFYDNLTKDNGFFTSMGNGFTIVLNGFWKNVGATAIMGIIVFAVLFFVTVLPEIIGTFTLLDQANPEVFDGSTSILSIIGTIFTVLLSFAITNLALIGQGMIYYSNEEEKGNNSLHSQIDLIGGESE